MITAATMSHIPCSPTFTTTAQQPLGMYLPTATATGSAASTATNTSSLCSTPIAMFNPNFHPLLQYVQQPSYPYTQPATTTIAPITPLVQPLTNVFEGVPIFLMPQNGFASGSPPVSSSQRISDSKANLSAASQTPKADTSKHFHIFVGDLAADIDSNALKAAFAPYGEISEVKIIRDPQTMKSKGYGFVSFPVKKNAEKAIEGMNKQILGGRQVRTNWATRKPCGSDDGSVKEQSYEEIYNATHMENTSVYVGNVNPNTTEEELREAFSSLGCVNEVRIFKQQGYAFVRYATKDAATRAILRMNGKEMNGQAIRCSWGRSTTDTSAVTALSFLGSNIFGINAQTWSQNQYFAQLYGPNALQHWQA
ncbi:hypothetical protein AB6A40_000112 [Gnathostoma spinigerum]|uniref:RRM domain-containing protein n=1 Tax=Gnathostoma spinigerum TaxID=75299 RepID=A0ABD6E1I0_9BILA